jgi:hypothetical protein
MYHYDIKFTSLGILEKAEEFRTLLNLIFVS